MTTNITATTLTAGQASKEATISQIIGELDAALSENFSADLTAGNITVTAAQLKGAQVFIAKNAPTTGRLVTFGTPSKRFISIQADASNTQNVSFVVGSTSLVVKPGSSKIVYLDGTTNGLTLANQQTLSDLVDVDESTPPSNGDYLRYDASTGKFKPWRWGVTTQTGDYGFLLVDMNTTIEFNSAGNHTFTIPLNATIAFPVGISIECIQLGTGHLTIAGAGGVTLDDITVVTTAQYQRIILRKVATDEWNIVLLAAGSGGGGGVTTFVALSDVPAAYTSAGSFAVKVNAGASALEFVYSPPPTIQFAAYQAAVPTTSQLIAKYIAAEKFVFPANFATPNSQASIGTAATGTPVFLVKNGATQIGTISVTSTTATFATTSGTAKTVNAGDVLTILAPSSVDATIADIAFTLLGTKSA